uniref:Uncharacterized protein n=1 Tax=Hanusia phi TaxID=3032 RepID=A0A7S0EI87_9CRYP
MGVFLSVIKSIRELRDGKMMVVIVNIVIGMSLGAGFGYVVAWVFANAWKFIIYLLMQTQELTTVYYIYDPTLTLWFLVTCALTGSTFVFLLLLKSFMLKHASSNLEDLQDLMSNLMEGESAAGIRVTDPAAKKVESASVESRKQ